MGSKDLKEGSSKGVQLSQKSICFKTLVHGHSEIQSHLQRALREVSVKKRYLKELEEKANELSDNILIQEERNLCISEKLCGITRAVQEKEKRQEALFVELADAKWRLHEGEKLMEKIKADQTEFRQKFEIHKAEVANAEKADSQMKPCLAQIAQIQEDIDRLQDYKVKLENGDSQLTAIRDGTKGIQLQQRKVSLREALNERSIKTELLYVDIDEKTEKVEQLQQQLQADEENYQSEINQLQSQLQCMGETERRMQRSVEYMQAKIDYGIRPPSPEPWTPVQHFEQSESEDQPIE